MRATLKVALAILLSSPLGLHAGEAELGSCESTVGPWESTGEPATRGLHFKEGDKYHVIWVMRTGNSDTRVDSEGSAGECTCTEADDALVWECRTVFAERPADIGTTQTYEWVAGGETFAVSRVESDGTRTEQGHVRRPR